MPGLSQYDQTRGQEEKGIPGRGESEDHSPLLLPEDGIEREVPHYENATVLLSDTLLYLEKWMKSDEERREKTVPSS